MSKPRPSIPQLRAWREDDITKWIMDRVYHKFPDFHDMLPLKSADKLLELNNKVGSRKVLEEIEKIIETGD